MKLRTRGDWCCEAFKAQYESGGERAFAVVVDTFLDGYAFLLQHRALDQTGDQAVAAADG